MGRSKSGGHSVISISPETDRARRCLAHDRQTQVQTGGGSVTRDPVLLGRKGQREGSRAIRVLTRRQRLFRRGLQGKKIWVFLPPPPDEEQDIESSGRPAKARRPVPEAVKSYGSVEDMHAENSGIEAVRGLKEAAKSAKIVC